MQAYSDFDDDYRRKCLPCKHLRSNWLLMLLLVATALTSAVIVRTVLSNKVGPKFRGGQARFAVIKPPVLPIAAQTDDHFVIFAEASIDAKMVVLADPDIDQAMVRDHKSRERLPVRSPGTGSVLAPDGMSREFSPPPR